MCTGQGTTGIPLLFWHEISHPICTAIVMCGSLRTMGKASPTLRTCSNYLVAAMLTLEWTCFIHLLWTRAGLVDNSICSLHSEITSVLFVCLLLLLFSLSWSLAKTWKKSEFSWQEVEFLGIFINYMYTPGPGFSNVLKFFRWHKSLCIVSENMFLSFEFWQILALYIFETYQNSSFSLQADHTFKNYCFAGLISYLVFWETGLEALVA